MLHVQIPASHESARRYAVAVLMEEFLGLDVAVETGDVDRTTISAGDGKTLRIGEGLFATSSRDWLTEGSLPKLPLRTWDTRVLGEDVTVIDRQLPVLYGGDPTAAGFFSQAPGAIELDLDVLGSAFFMLTRYEEVVRGERDRHDRFPARQSVAWTQGFLDRPIVNEYTEVLWALLRRLWPALRRKTRSTRTIVSHDVDHPFAVATGGVRQLVRRAGGDLLRRRSLRQALASTAAWVKVRRGDLAADPNNTFDRIMDLSERRGLRSAFYFIADHSAGRIDGIYDLQHPAIRHLLRSIHHRGHEIGLHTSYNTYRDAAQTKREFDRLLRICGEEGIRQQRWGVRQHFLRWHTPTTFQNLADAGLDYDTTLSFADHAGFRCGVCYEFPVFNVVTLRRLPLVERPLIVMETSVLDPRYMNQSGSEEQAVRTMCELKRRCRMFRGDFTLLYHNTMFIQPEDRRVYEQVLDAT